MGLLFQLHNREKAIGGEFLHRRTEGSGRVVGLTCVVCMMPMTATFLPGAVSGMLIFLLTFPIVACSPSPPLVCRSRLTLRCGKSLSFEGSPSMLAKSHAIASAKHSHSFGVSRSVSMNSHELQNMSQFR